MISLFDKICSAEEVSKE